MIFKMTGGDVRRLGCALWVLLGAWTVLSVPARGAPAKPDILVLMTDQQRADALGIAGTPGASTPHLDQLARTSLRFTDAFTITPQCSPARAALWSGKYPHHTGVQGNVAADGRVPAGMSAPLPRRITTIAQHFAAAGYETAYFGKWHLGRTPADYGFRVQSGHGSDSSTTQRAVAFLQERMGRTNRAPLLMVVSWVNPHDVYEVLRAEALVPEKLAFVQLPQNLRDDLTQKPFPQRHYLEADQGKPFQHFTGDQWRRYIAFYFEQLAKVDAEIGSVLRAVAPVRSNTIVAFTSDHGDLGGAHGLPFKGPALYEELIRVPFFLSWPGRIAPGTNATMVTHLDLLPTLCDLAGLEAPHDLDGESLAAIARGETSALAGRDAILGEYHGKQEWRVPIRMIRTRQWKLVRYQEYGDELYDLVRDPGELRNLAGAAEHAAVREELENRLADWISESWDTFPRDRPTDRSGRPIEKERELAVASEFMAGSCPNVVMVAARDNWWTHGDAWTLGTERRPHLAKFAEESAFFENAYLTVPDPKPGVLTLLTGLYPSEHRFCCGTMGEEHRTEAAAWVRQVPTVVRLLGKRGARTLFLGETPGFDPRLLGFEQVLGDGNAGLERSGARRDLQEWLNQKPGEPFVICLSGTGQLLDDMLGALMDSLEQRGLREKTLTVALALRGKSSAASPARAAASEAATRAPLLLHWPGRIPPGVRSNLVSTIDVVPTILGVCGTTSDGLEGSDLMRLLSSVGPAEDKLVFGEVYAEDCGAPAQPELNLTHLWMRQGEWKLVARTVSSSMELFHLGRDPGELSNAAATEAERAETMRQALDRAWSVRQH